VRKQIQKGDSRFLVYGDIYTAGLSYAVRH
jgi:hypothetical protein